MNINYLIELLGNRITSLTLTRDQTFSAGDLDRINNLDAEIASVQNTISQLRLLQTANDAAASANLTTANIISSGIDTISKTTPIIQGPSASAVINGYDISAYATDPLYETKIQNILDRMPIFNVVGDIDNYIFNFAPSSPVTGSMVYLSTNKYGIDLPLLVAIMQNDSEFGTTGVGANTFNPGNVGNTGYATQSFPSWSDGVDAVAEWLSRHRVTTPTYQVDTTTPVSSIDTTPIVLPVAVDPYTPVSSATSTATITSTPTSTATTTATTDNSDATSTPVSFTASSTPTVITNEATTTPVLDLSGTSTSSSTKKDSQIQAMRDTKNKRRIV